MFRRTFWVLVGVVGCLGRPPIGGGACRKLRNPLWQQSKIKVFFSSSSLNYDRLPRNGITPRERALALADGGSRARLYTERFPPHDASPYHCTLWEAGKADVARNNLPNHFGVSYSRTLVGCAISVLSGVGSKLPLPRYADMRLHIPMYHTDDRPGGCCHRCRSSSGQNGSTRTSLPGQRGG